MIDRRKRVLIIDENGMVASVMGRAVERLGYTAKVITEGKTAHAFLRYGHDLAAVFLDLFLADLPGSNLLDLIKANPATRHVPVFLVSDTRLSVAERARLESRVTACFCKDAYGLRKFEALAREALEKPVSMGLSA